MVERTQLFRSATTVLSPEKITNVDRLINFIIRSIRSYIFLIDT